MTQIKSVILFIVLVIAGVSCHETTIGELPTDIQEELRGIVEGTAKFNWKADCRTRLRSNIDLLLYTRDNQDDPIILNLGNSKQMDPTRKLVILIHGWLAAPATSGIAKMKNAYLKRYNSNVIVVDWSKATRMPYSSSYCHVQAVAQYVAKALCFLKRQANLDFDQVHIIGHSLGAHVAGWVGKYVSTKCMGRIGRITGLDPAGPIFETLPAARKLDKIDAMFVDVIHTDGEKFGSIGKYGHADFYPNCGQAQPGCPSFKNASDDTLLSDVFCSHHRSMDYMAESILSSNYIAVSCGMCPRYCRADSMSEQYRVMGEDARHEPRVNKNFYVPTKNSAPYFEGWNAYSGVSNKFV